MGVESKAAARERIAQQRAEVERREAIKDGSIPFGAKLLVGGAGATIGVGFIVVPSTIAEAKNKNIMFNEALESQMSGGHTGTTSETVQQEQLVNTHPADYSGGYALGIGLAVLLACVAVVTKIKPAKKKSQVSIPNSTASEPSYSEQWRALDERRNSLMIQWSRYETDVALMIDYPIMTDYTDPVIGKVITAMQEMRNAEMLTGDRDATPVRGSAMLSAVNKFEFALLAAEKYARRYGQSKLSQREQRKLSAARTALNIILDGEAPTHEVEAAYKSLRGSLVGIIALQPEAVIALEKQVRRELTTA